MFTTLISTADLAARLGAPDLAIVDVRHDLAQPDAWGAAQYAAGHVPGARFAHLDRDLSAPKTGRNGRHPLPTPEACAAVFGRLGIGAGTQVVCYDQQPGMYASRLWWMLRWLGHDAVAVLDGGWARWTAEGRPVATAVPPPGTATFTPRASAVGAVAVEAVVASLPSRSLLLLDARAPERFRGETEPLDPVAGHIPGATNRPYAQNLNPDGTFKPATDAARRVRRADRRPAARHRRAPVRLGRHRVPQPAGDGNRRARRHPALPRLVERVGRRSDAPGRDGKLSRRHYKEPSMPALAPSRRTRRDRHRRRARHRPRIARRFADEGARVVLADVAKRRCRRRRRGVDPRRDVRRRRRLAQGGRRRAGRGRGRAQRPHRHPGQQRRHHPRLRLPRPRRGGLRPRAAAST